MGVFRFVAPHQRAVASSLFGTVWNVYLSFKAQLDEGPPEVDEGPLKVEEGPLEEATEGGGGSGISGGG